VKKAIRCRVRRHGISEELLAREIHDDQRQRVERGLVRSPGGVGRSGRR